MKEAPQEHQNARARPCLIVFPAPQRKSSGPSRDFRLEKPVERTRKTDGESVFGQSGSPFGPNGFDGGMGMGMGMGGAIKTPSYKNEGY